MRVALLVAFGWLTALAACSSPNPVLYTIAPVQGPVQTSGPKVVALQQISLARYLERSQIVRSSENYRLDVMSNDWWGEPLGAMLSRCVIEELGQRLPQSVVIGESGAVTASPGRNDRTQPAAARRGCSRKPRSAGPGEWSASRAERGDGAAQLPLCRDPAGARTFRERSQRSVPLSANSPTVWRSMLLGR